MLQEPSQSGPRQLRAAQSIAAHIGCGAVREHVHRWRLKRFRPDQPHAASPVVPHTAHGIRRLCHATEVVGRNTPKGHSAIRGPGKVFEITFPVCDRGAMPFGYCTLVLFRQFGCVVIPWFCIANFGIVVAVLQGHLRNGRLDADCTLWTRSSDVDSCSSRPPSQKRSDSIFGPACRQPALTR